MNKGMNANTNSANLDELVKNIDAQIVPLEAEEAMKQLSETGIGCRPFFWPMHEQPVFQKMGLFAGERYPVAERLARRGFYIPSGLALTSSQMDKVGEAVRSLFQ